eukprot:9053109-Pyramimonas_sp.AAC.1
MPARALSACVRSAEGQAVGLHAWGPPGVGALGGSGPARDASPGFYRAAWSHQRGSLWAAGLRRAQGG